jgi:phenylalanyl-tRNA synthetase alpha chain
MNLQVIEEQALLNLSSAQDLSSLEEERLHYLGKKGLLTQLMKDLGAMDPEARKIRASALNVFKDKFQDLYSTKKELFETQELNAKLSLEKVDITLPVLQQKWGTLHPLRMTIDHLETLFKAMDFETAYGPDIETDEYNFNALNIPLDHPARQGHDTFYITTPNGEKKLLRTHTSPVQIHTMRSFKPPFRFIAPGRAYRVDDDATHAPNFHQIEGFVVEKNIHMGHLKGTLMRFLKEFFGSKF